MMIEIRGTPQLLRSSFIEFVSFVHHRDRIPIRPERYTVVLVSNTRCIEIEPEGIICMSHWEGTPIYLYIILQLFDSTKEMSFMSKEEINRKVGKIQCQFERNRITVLADRVAYCFHQNV